MINMKCDECGVHVQDLAQHMLDEHSKEGEQR